LKRIAEPVRGRGDQALPCVRRLLSDPGLRPRLRRAAHRPFLGPEQASVRRADQGGKKLATGRGNEQPACAFRRTDALVRAYGHTLRLVVSDDPGNGNARWYLLSNDLRSSRRTIIRRYYHRFEIEEFFRDAKHILGFERLRFKTAQGFAVALWFAILTCWFFAIISAKLTQAQESERKQWRVSRFRYVYEKLMQGLWRQAERAVGLAASSVAV
jgi:hypothetical protein